MKLKALASPIIAIALATTCVTATIPQAMAAEIPSSAKVVGGKNPSKYLTPANIDRLVGFTSGNTINTKSEDWEEIQDSAVAVANYYNKKLSPAQKLAVLEVFFAMSEADWDKTAEDFKTIKYQKCDLYLGTCLLWGSTETTTRKTTGLTVPKIYKTLPLTQKKALWGQVDPNRLRARSLDLTVKKQWISNSSPWDEYEAYKQKELEKQKQKELEKQKQQQGEKDKQGVENPEAGSMDQITSVLGSSEKDKDGEKSEGQGGLLAIAGVIALLGALAAVVGQSPQFQALLPR